MHEHEGWALFHESARRRRLRLALSALRCAGFVGVAAWLLTSSNNAFFVLPYLLGGWGLLDLLKNASRRSLVFAVGPEGIGFQQRDGSWMNAFWSTVRSFDFKRHNTSAPQAKSWINLDDPDKGRHSVRIPLQSLDPDICDQLIAAIQTHRSNGPPPGNSNWPNAGAA